MDRFRNTFSVCFYCRNSKISKTTNLAPIEMGVNILGDRFFINTARKGKPNSFLKDPDTRLYLTTIEQRVYEWHTECIRRGKKPTKQGLQEFIASGWKMDDKSLKSLYAAFFDSVEKRHQAGQLTKQGVAKYHQAIDPFFKDIDMEQECSIITKKMIVDWHSYIIAKYKNSTAIGMLTKMKSLWLFARDNGYVDVNMFSGIKISKKLEEVIPLTMEELSIIENHHFEIERLERVRSIFLFSCYTGLAFVDTQNLEPSDFKVNDRKQMYLEKERAKTGVKYCVVIMPQAKAIAEKYEYRLPRISNQRCNGYLQEIQHICGIEKHLHFHLARHTFATLCINHFHFSPEITAKIMGHSLTVAKHYQKMWASTLFDAFDSVVPRKS